jgi:hypothetical protein
MIAPPPLPSPMKRHVDLVGVLFLLWGGMILVLSLSLLSIGFAATAIGASGNPRVSSAPLAAGLVAAGFFTLAAAGFLFGGVHVWLGTRVRGCREWARAFAIVLAIVDLVLVPFGTGLGIYTLWALLHSGTRRLFDTPHLGARG